MSERWSSLLSGRTHHERRTTRTTLEGPPAHTTRATPSLGGSPLETHGTPSVCGAYALSLLCLALLGCGGGESKPEGSESSPSETAPSETTPGARWYEDADGDGYGDPSEAVDAAQAPLGYVSDDTDCDDGDSLVHPGADEICNDLDDDCDDLLDDDDEGLIGGEIWPADADGDGFSSLDPSATVVACEAPAADGGDCDDLDPLVYPGADERETRDGADDNCNGWVDEGASPFGDARIYDPSAEMLSWPVRLGDIDGDSIADFSPSGRELFLGGARYAGAVDLSSRDIAFDGGTASAAGDQDGDGADDLWVSGSLVVGLGGRIGQQIDAGEEAVATMAGTVYASGLDGVGDVDGDGFADISGYAFLGDGLYSYEMPAIILPGGVLGEIDESYAIGLIHSPYYLMGLVSVVPDVSGDGLGEVIASDGSTTAGLWLGGSLLVGMTTDAERHIIGWFTFEDALDIDGDGIKDLITCMDSQESCHVVREADLPPGDSLIDSVALASITGVKQLTAVDLNGDGIRDLVGSNSSAASYAGEVYLFDGSTLPAYGTLDASEALAVWTGDANSYFGDEVRNVGDVDGDGFEDLLVTSDPIVVGVTSEAFLMYGGGL